MVFGVDQSLSNTGIIMLDVVGVKNYYQELTYLLKILKDLINLLNNRKQEYLKILKKSINKSFNFEDELRKSKYSEKEQSLIIALINDLQNAKTKFKKNYLNIELFYNDFLETQQKNSNKTISLQNYFTIDSKLLSPKMVNTKRLSFYKQEYNKIVTENRDNIDIAVIEGYSYGSQATQSIFELGELAGQFKCINYEHNIETIIVPPSTLKKVIIGSGKAKKEEINKYFSTSLNYDFKIKKNDDLYDALALSLFVTLMPYLELETLLKIKFND